MHKSCNKVEANIEPQQNTATPQPEVTTITIVTALFLGDPQLYQSHNSFYREVKLNDGQNLRFALNRCKIVYDNILTHFLQIVDIVVTAVLKTATVVLSAVILRLWVETEVCCRVDVSS